MFYELGEEKLEIFDKGRSQDEARTKHIRRGNGGDLIPAVYWPVLKERIGTGFIKERIDKSFFCFWIIGYTKNQEMSDNL